MYFKEQTVRTMFDVNGKLFREILFLIQFLMEHPLDSVSHLKPETDATLRVLPLTTPMCLTRVLPTPVLSVALNPSLRPDDISYKWESRLSQSVISSLSASDYHRVGIIFYATIANQLGSSPSLRLVVRGVI